MPSVAVPFLLSDHVVLKSTPDVAPPFPMGIIIHPSLGEKPVSPMYPWSAKKMYSVLFTLARNRTHQSLSYVGQAMSPAAAAEPAVNILPPTPLRDDKTVRFMGKTRNKNEFRAVDSIVAPVPQHATRRSHLSQPEMNQPHRDRAGSQSNLGETGDLSIKTPRSALRNKVHLPDVTGLTSAIASPARKGWEFYGVNTRDEREVDGEFHILICLDTSHIFITISPPYCDSECRASETCSS